MSAQDDLQDEFVKISVILTGFAKSVIAPDVDPIGLPELFYKTTRERSGTACTRLLVGASQIAVVDGMTDARLGAILMGLENNPLTTRPLPDEQTAIDIRPQYIALSQSYSPGTLPAWEITEEGIYCLYYSHQWREIVL